MHEVLESWVGTPYALGQSRKGLGVDCVRFVVGVYNELYREERAVNARMPQDTAMHNPAGAAAVLRQVLRCFPAHVEVDHLEPGDLAITARPGCGPGHSVIAGPEYLYHAGPGGVVRAGLSIFLTHPIYRIYRITDKDQWASTRTR